MLLLTSLSTAGPVLGAADPAFPPLSGRVVDSAGILDKDTVRTLTGQLAGFEKSSGGAQLVVVTVPSLGGRAIEDYGYLLGRHWGIGQRDGDDGALLIVAVAERRVRIEVGYGLEGRLTDAIAADIISRRILPEFRAGDMNAGVTAGTRAMIAALGGDYAAAPPDQAGDAADRHRLWAVVFWVIIMLLLFSGRRRRRRGLEALFAGAVLGGLPGSGARGGGGFSGGGGGFSGGGGSFGGGGASGGW